MGCGGFRQRDPFGQRSGSFRGLHPRPPARGWHGSETRENPACGSERPGRFFRIALKAPPPRLHLWGVNHTPYFPIFPIDGAEDPKTFREIRAFGSALPGGLGSRTRTPTKSVTSDLGRGAHSNHAEHI